MGILACALITPVCAAVSTPTFSPGAGDGAVVFPVTVSCTTSGAVIHYTVSGAEPTIYDPVVVSNSTVLMNRRMTLKAKAFTSSESSATASALYKVTGEISAGSQYILGVASDGKAYSWGNQTSGRMSTGVVTNTNILSAAQAKYGASSLIGNAISVAAGANHGLLLDSSRGVWGFGSNFYGEAGNSVVTDPGPYATKVAQNAALTQYLTNCSELAAGLEFSLALESSGYVQSWGNQASGRLGNNATANGSRKYAARVRNGTAASAELGGIVGISAGKDFGIARDSTGKVWGWGSHGYGQLGQGNPLNNQAYAVKVKVSSGTDLTDATDADCGDDFTAIVRWKTGESTLQGSVWTCGNRVNGRLGDNGAITGTASYPVQVQKQVTSTTYAQLNGITQVSAGGSHVLALDNNGNVWAWGNNANGALGNNSTAAERKYAMKVRNTTDGGDLENIVWISAGGFNGSAPFSTAVAADGTVYVWGSNATGLFGNGNNNNPATSKLPVAVGSLTTLPGFPTISLASSIVTPKAPGAVNVTATVDDPQGSGTVTKVEYYVQGGLQVTDTVPPFQANLTSLAAGSYHVYAVATDANGNQTTSLPVTFQVEQNFDTDDDGLLDAWEMTYFGNLNQTAAGDFDGDKVTNLQEHTLSSNPTTAADANADGIPDDWVTWQLSLPGGVTATTLAPGADPDQDELTNLVEYQLNTKARHLDSDGDGQSDWQEVSQSTDPNNASSLAAPLAVSAYQGAAGPTVPLSLTNPVTSLGYNLTLSGNVPIGAGYLMTSSNVGGGPAYEWIDISTTGEHLTAFNSNRYTVVQRSIPFGFSLYGTAYSNIFVSGYGFVTLVDPGGSNPGFPLTFRAPLPNTGGHKPLIAPYEQYLEPDVAGAIYYQAFSDKVVVQWEQVKVTYSAATVLVSFQAVIYPDGSIRFNYKSIPPTDQNVNIVGYLAGIQNAAGTDGMAASWHTSGAQQGMQIHALDPLTIRFAHPVGTPWVTTSTGSVSGNPLGWNLLFDSDELALGVHQATMKIAKAGGPVLYSRPVNLTIAENPDIDGDGLPNTWENTYGLNPNDNGSVNVVNGPLGDPDGDKVTNLQEFLQGTNPIQATDANADGIPDHWVTWQLSLPGGVTASSLAANADPDQDELTNLVEFQKNTKARHFDSDGDGQSDWQEVAQATDPNNATSKVGPLQVAGYQSMSPSTVPISLVNPVPALGYDLTLPGNGGATPWVTASVANANGNPLSWNLVFDGAGLPLGLKTAAIELRKASGPVLYSRPIEFTVAQDPDTDGDGMSDPWETAHGLNPNDNGSINPVNGASGDLDGDKVTNLQEYLQGTDPNAATDANSDGIPDHWVTWQLSLPGGVTATTLAAGADPDQDGMTNLIEYQKNTKARHFDSDGDGQSDWQEVAQGTNPNNAGSTSTAPLEVSGDLTTNGLASPQALINPNSSLGYELQLTGNGGATPWVTASSSALSGSLLAWDFLFSGLGQQVGLHTATVEIRKTGGPVLFTRSIKFTIAEGPDTDADGMPDGWEIFRGLDPEVDDRLEDFDGDRIPNIVEFLRGTSPNDEEDAPPATFVVDPATGGSNPNDNVYPTIAAALAAADLRDEDYNNQADPYSVILIRSGVYSENVVLDGAPVVLLGELGGAAGPVEIRASQTTAAVTIDSASVVDGFILTHQTGTMGAGVAVTDVAASANKRRRMINCIVRGNYAVNSGGIDINDCELDLVHCTVIANKAFIWPGVGVTDSTLNLWNSAIVGNTQDGNSNPAQIGEGFVRTIHASEDAPSYVGRALITPVPGLTVLPNPGISTNGFLIDAYVPAANAGGVIASTAVRYDVQGQLRPSGVAPDIGADEFHSSYYEEEEEPEPQPSATVDSDGDGIPDQWEIAHSLDPQVANPVTDLQAYLNESLSPGEFQVHTPFQ